MIDLLLEQPLLTLFVVVAVGAALGAVRLGPVRFGAAGALFVGLVLSAMYPSLSGDWLLIQQLGLLLFVYTVGIASGATFRVGLRQNLPLLWLSVIAATVAALLTAWLGHAFSLPKDLTVGLFTGALTAAPALDTASRMTEGASASAGYSFGYPLGVIVGIVVATLVVGMSWQGKKDTPSLAGRGLQAVTVLVKETMNPRDLRSWVEQKIRLSYVFREGTMGVLVPGEDLRKGDHVVVVGEPGVVEASARQVGEIVEDHLADDRSEVDFERLIVSNPEVAGRSVTELNLPARFGALVTRVRRGDLDLLARDDLDLQLGDQVAVVVPRDQLGAVRSYFGDSQRQVAEVDALALGSGLVLGLLAGMVSIPLPGVGLFQLGPAAGPLIVGMVLGAFRRSGPLVWTLPMSANLTIRQLGLLFFLAALGLRAGPDVLSLFDRPEGVWAAILAAVVVLTACLTVAVGGRVLGLSAPRTAGGVAGFLGQPAVLQAANARVADERIDSAYAILFAASIIVKIFLVPLVLVL